MAKNHVEGHVAKNYRSESSVSHLGLNFHRLGDTKDELAGSGHSNESLSGNWEFRVTQELSNCYNILSSWDSIININFPCRTGIQPF